MPLGGLKSPPLCSTFPLLESRDWRCCSQKGSMATRKTDSLILLFLSRARHKYLFQKDCPRAVKKTQPNPLQNRKERLGLLEQTCCWKAGWRSSITLRLSFAFIKAFCCRGLFSCFWVLFLSLSFFIVSYHFLFSLCACKSYLRGAVFLGRGQEKQFRLHSHFPSWPFTLLLPRQGSLQFPKLISSKNRSIHSQGHYTVLEPASNCDSNHHTGETWAGTVKAQQALPQPCVTHGGSRTSLQPFLKMPFPL